MPAPASPHTWTKAAAIIATGAIALGLVGCASSGPTETGGTLADMEPITLTWAEYVAEASVSGAGAKAFMDYVEERTDGKVAFEVYWASALFGGSETVASVGAGVADIGMFATSFNPDDVPIANYLLRAGVEADSSFPLGLLQGAAATNEFFSSNPDLREEFAQLNLVPIRAMSTARYSLLCKDPVTTPAEAAGKRTRVGGGAWVAEAESLGMAAQFTPVPEIYEALQRGVLDCVVLPASAMADTSLWEVAKHFTPAAFSPFPGGVHVINMDVWNSFPDELKQIFAEAAIESQAVQLQADLTSLARFVTEGESEFDVVFHDPAALDEAIIGQQEEVLASLPSEPPAELSDPEAFLAEYRGLLDKWLDIFTNAGVAAGLDQTLTNNAVAASESDIWVDPYKENSLAGI